MHTGGDEEGILLWIESGNKRDKWQQASVTIKHQEAFWVMMIIMYPLQTFICFIDPSVIHVLYTVVYENVGLPNLSSLPQFVFAYQRGNRIGGDVALDDVTVLPGPCYSEPTVEPPGDSGNIYQLASHSLWGLYDTRGNSHVVLLKLPNISSLWL